MTGVGEEAFPFWGSWQVGFHFLLVVLGSL